MRPFLAMVGCLFLLCSGASAQEATLDETLFPAVLEQQAKIEDTLFTANVPETEAVTTAMIQRDIAQLQHVVAQLSREQAPADDVTRDRVRNELFYISMLCALSVITTTIILVFMRNREHDARDIVNAAGLNLIIVGTIILVLVVDTSEQLTAAIGVMGAIAGYLFRSMQDGGERGEAGQSAGTMSDHAPSSQAEH